MVPFDKIQLTVEFGAEDGKVMSSFNLPPQLSFLLLRILLLG